MNAMCHETSRANGLSLTREAASVIRFPISGDRHPAKRNPDLDPAEQIRRYGRLLGWTRVWLNRSRMRRDLMDLALRQPDSVLDDAGLTRQVALREASKWFWLPPEL